MKIKYGELEFYSNWLLDNLSLAGKKSRMRMKFLEIISAHQQDYQKHRFNLIKEHSRLDDQENPIVLNQDENGNGQYDIIDMVAFEKDYIELATEEIVIEESEGNREMLHLLKTCIENCPIEWSGKLALEYETVCRLFDDVYSDSV